MEPIRLSSRATVLYKLILPIFIGVVALLIWVLAIVLHGEPDAEALVVIGAILTGFLLLMLPFMLLNKVSYDDDFLYAYNYRTTKKIPINKLKKVNSFMLYLFKITYINEVGQRKRIILLPSFEQRMDAMMGKPANLINLEKLINKSYKNAHFYHF